MKEIFRTLIIDGYSTYLVSHEIITSDIKYYPIDIISGNVLEAVEPTLDLMKKYQKTLEYEIILGRKKK